MVSKKQDKPRKTCADCIHEFACQMWTLGRIHEMNAENCPNHETVKDSAAYLIGKLEGKKEGADNG